MGLFDQFMGGMGAMGGAPGGQGQKPGQTGGGRQQPQQEVPQMDIDFNELGEKLFSKSKKFLITLGIVWVICLAVYYWWVHPPLNIHSQESWMFVGVGVLLPLFIIGFLGKRFYGEPKGSKDAKKGKGAKGGKSTVFNVIMWIPIIALVFMLAGVLLSASFFPGNAEKYSSLLKTEESTFAKDIDEADYKKIPFIDAASATLLGNRTMGTMADYVSQFEIDPIYSQINYQGKPVRVSPLNYADFFKWWTNKDTGIPAYVIVDMNTQDTQIVRLKEPIYYTDSDPFFKNVDRHVQLSHPFDIFGEKSFEIDEEGNPFWIYPVLDYTIGLFGGPTVKRVIICNASSGEIQDVDINDVPSWVDRAYPADLLIQQYNWYGLYDNGWLNSWLGQEGVKQTTDGTDGSKGYNYIAQNDDVWVYSGVTSATSDNSIIGFIMINQRTGESHFYSVAGATENSAMLSAEGQVQHLKYDATFPLLLNVDGVPTYFMALKDDAGLVKMYAMVDIERYQNVAVGDTLAATEASYENLLKNNGVITSGNKGGSTNGNQAAGTTSGVISVLTNVVIKGNTHIYVVLDGNPTIYDCPITSVVEIARYKVGDSITLTYDANSTESPVKVKSVTAAAQQ